MKDKLIKTKTKGHTVKARGTRSKMHHKEKSKMQFYINRSQWDPKGKAIVVVQKKYKDRTVVELEGKEEI